MFFSCPETKIAVKVIIENSSIIFPDMTYTDFRYNIQNDEVTAFFNASI